ncbi:MAG: Spy/CpxP family protein refolding chaperone [Hylemonella sp.]|nr:Spy/CpxP family protein refolding chaperone [Hylemonella sp.]MDP1937123.1 Spy/CpxP family protein refolding chaperone [Hylemonella sp.]
MKPWIKRSLIALTSATVVLGGLTACGSRGDHARGWSDERVTEMRGKAVEKISDKLELNAGQKAKLGVLADEMVASRKAMRGKSGDFRNDLQALIAVDKFDRTKAQQMLDQKTQALQGSGPKVLAAFGDFYDSLNPEQQKQVRERLERRGHGWWGRG